MDTKRKQAEDNKLGTSKPLMALTISAIPELFNAVVSFFSDDFNRAARQSARRTLERVDRIINDSGVELTESETVELEAMRNSMNKVIQATEPPQDGVN